MFDLQNLFYSAGTRRFPLSVQVHKQRSRWETTSRFENRQFFFSTCLKRTQPEKLLSTRLQKEAILQTVQRDEGQQEVRVNPIFSHVVKSS